MHKAILNFRYQLLLDAWNGYQVTNVPLVSFDGTTFTPTYANADDLGMYVLIPKLGKLLHLSFPTTVCTFFYLILFGSALLGAIGFCLFYKTMYQRIVAISSLSLLTLFALRVGNTYISYCAAVIGIVPLYLYFFEHEKDRYRYLFLLAAGIALGFFDYIRLYSSIAVIFFIIATIVSTNKLYSWQKKIVCIMSLSIGLLMPWFYFNTITNQYKQYAAIHFADYPPMIQRHSIWHTIYCGFGFLMLGNERSIKFEDGASFNCIGHKYPDINWSEPKNYSSHNYEQLVRNEVFDIVKNEKAFVIRTIFAKFGVIFMYLLIFAHLGLVAAYRFPKPYFLELSFWLAMALQSIFPLLVLPIHSYTLGFISFATIYGIASINYAIERGFLKKILSRRSYVCRI